jgi:cytidine deaminase
MKHLNININIDICSKQELTTEEQQLVDRALQASYHSFAPYSHFHVGAAALLENGITVIGANQENAAFPSGLCGERACIFSAQSQYPDQPIRILAIAARNGEKQTEEPVTPCGSCRQVILQMEQRYHKPVKILLCGKEKYYRVSSIHDLLPLSFDQL